MPQNETNILRCLTDLGMSEREAKVYLAILKMKSASAADLYKPSGIPRTKIYDIIKSLVFQGYCSEKRVNGKIIYEVIDPGSALQARFLEYEERYRNSQKIREELKAIYSREGEAVEPIEYVEFLHGKASVHHYYCGLIRAAKSEILGFRRGPYAFDTIEKDDEQDLALMDFLRRGGESRRVFEVNSASDADVFDHEHFIIEQTMGARIRINRKLPLKMFLFDREIVLVAQEDILSRTGELVMSVIKNKAVADAFTALFEHFWENSVDFNKWDVLDKAIDS